MHLKKNLDILLYLRLWSSDMTDLTRLTISESLSKLKAKEISPVELTEAFI